MAPSTLNPKPQLFPRGKNNFHIHIDGQLLLIGHWNHEQIGLMDRLEALVDQMKQDRAFGQIAIAFRDGEPDYICKETTEKLGVQGNSHAKQAYR